MWTPDQVIRADTIHTMNPSQPRAQWMAIHHGKIVATGLGEPLGGPVKDLGPVTIVPGFNDAHCHTMWFGLSLGDVDAASCKTLDELYDALAERAKSTPQGQWVRATGYNQVSFGGVYPDIEVLDRILPHHPLFMRHTSGHACIVNTKALQLVGLDGSTEIAGGAVVRDEHGQPTGLLEERAQGIVQEALLPISMDDMVQALGRAGDTYSAEGITSFTETGIAGGWIGHSPREFAAYQKAQERGLLRQRAQLMVVSDVLHHLDGHDSDLEVLGIDSGMRSGAGNDFLQLGPTKIFLDGSMLAWTGAVSEPFSAGPSDNYGYFQAPEEELRHTMLRAAAGGWAVAAHAIGDRAVALALDTFEEAIARCGNPVMPHRIEHGGVVTDEQVQQASRLGVAIVTQPGFMPELGVQMREAMGPTREASIHRHRSLIDAGVLCAGSSDRPVANGAPLHVMQAMVERRDASGEVVGPGERVSIEQALWSYTVGSAQTTGQSAVKGQLRTGMAADYVVLSSDPLAVPSDAVASVAVLATAIGGEEVFSAEGK